MKTHAMHLVLAAGLALAMGNALADSDSDSGDNSMSQWTGESYAAFHSNQVGDFYTSPSESAAIEPSPDTAPAVPDKSDVSRTTNPFRDDTAA